MRLFPAILASALAVFGCVQFPTDAIFSCKTDRDCHLDDEYCSAEKTCLPLRHADGGSVPDAGTAVPADGGPVEPADASRPRLDATIVVVEPDAASPGLDAATPAGLDAAFTPGSCRDILERDPKATDGYADIVTAGDAGVEVYCLQSFWSGGWTLIGRSSHGSVAGDSFGWYQAAGTVRDANNPYSLDALARGMSFSELLVASQDATLDVGAERYWVQLTADWAQPELGAPSALVQNVSLNSAGCPNETRDGAMLSFVGCTKSSDHFFLRDNGECMNFGLYPTGFALAHTGCTEGGSGGNLDGQQGYLFAR